MSKRNSYDLNLRQKRNIQKLNRSVYQKQYRLKKLFDVDTPITRRTEFNDYDDYRSYLNDVSNFRNRKNYRYVKTDSGIVLPRDMQDNIQFQVDRINKERVDRLNKIKDVTYTTKGKDTAMKVEDVIKMRGKINRNRFSESIYDDLDEIKIDINMFENEKEMQEKLELYQTSDYFNLKKRDEIYRTNYIKALRKNFAHISDSDIEKLVEKVESVNIEDFMMLYYTEEKGNIKSHYDVVDETGHLEQLNDVFDEILK